MAPKSAPSQRYGLSSSKSVRNLPPPNHHGNNKRSCNKTCSDNSLDERDPLNDETDDEAHTRRLIKALAEQSYHLPGHGYWEDMIQWFLNNHPLLGICFHHRLHPIGCGMRMLGFFASTVFGLAITNLVWLWFIYEEDETKLTVDLSEVSKANLTGYLDDVNESNQLEITNGVIYLWTVGGALHGLFDTTIWKLSMCSCCEGLQAQGKYKRFGVGLMTFGVILITACTTLIVVFRATFESNEDADIAELKSAGIFDDAIELDSGVKNNYQFLLSFSVELALALVVYFPVSGIIMFSGILACKKNIPILGGRPYEVYLYEKELAEEEEARRRAQRKDEFADEDLGGLRAALTKRASTLFAGRKASVHGGMSNNRMNSSRDLNRMNSSRDMNRMNSSRADLNASSARLNSSREDLNASNSRLGMSTSRMQTSRADLNTSMSRSEMSNSRLHSSRADLNASGSRLHMSSGSFDFDEELGLERKDAKRRPASSSSGRGRESSSRNLDREASSRFTLPTRSSSESPPPRRSSSRDVERHPSKRTSSRSPPRRSSSRDVERHSPNRTSSRESDRDDPRYASPSRGGRSRYSDRSDPLSSSEPRMSSSRRDHRDDRRRSSSRDSSSRDFERDYRDERRRSNSRDSSSRDLERDYCDDRRRSSSRDSSSRDLERDNRDDRRRSSSRDSSSRDFQRSAPKRTSSRHSTDSRSQGDYDRSTPKRTSSRSSERSPDSRSYRDRGSSSNGDKRSGGSKVHDSAAF